MENIKKYSKSIIGIIVCIVVMTTILVSMSDNGNAKQLYDGLVVTDKANKSYILQHSGFGKFKISEFDITNMRMKR